MRKDSLILFAIIIAGFVFNQGHAFSYLIKYFLMAMLFFPFLRVSTPKDRIVYLQVMALFGAMAGLSTLFYLALMNWNRQLAIVSFLLAFTPTATAAPVVIGLLRKNVDYVATAVVLTNLLVALSLPFVLPMINSQHSNINVAAVLLSTMMVMGIPLLLAALFKYFFPLITNNLVSMNRAPFLIWLVVLYLATSKASAYLFEQQTAPLTLVGEIALISLVICVANFMIGKILGGTMYGAEASQALGQKNTMFMTWVALEYINPVAALGPVCYLVVQNLYNSFLLSRGYRPN